MRNLNEFPITVDECIDTIERHLNDFALKVEDGFSGVGDIEGLTLMRTMEILEMYKGMTDEVETDD